MNRSRTRCVAVIVVLLSTINLYACSNQGSKGSVSVLGPWIGTEQSDFRQVLDAFTAETGIQVNYQGTRALTQVLLSNVQAGAPPDRHAVQSRRTGEVRAKRRLYPLDDVIDQAQRAAFIQLWLLPQEKGDKSHIYTVPIKVNLMSLVWFSPDQAPKPTPRTWDELVTYSQSIADGGTAPWCMGMGDGPVRAGPGRI